MKQKRPQKIYVTLFRYNDKVYQRGSQIAGAGSRAGGLWAGLGQAQGSPATQYAAAFGAALVASSDPT